MNTPRVTLLDGSGEADLDELVTFRVVPRRMGLVCTVCTNHGDRTVACFEIDWGAHILALCKRHAQRDWPTQYAATIARRGELTVPAVDIFGEVAL